MFLLAMLMIIGMILVLFTALALSVGGAVFIIIFADVIVCILVIAWLIKHLARRKK